MKGTSGEGELVPMGPRWRRILRGETPQAIAPRLGRRVLSLLPCEARCKFCNAPFDGPMAAPFRLLRYAASRRNPNICSRCMESAPEGGAVVPVTVLFADIRGYTSIAEQSTPLATTALVRRFYAAAARALLRHEAVLASIAGDEVMAVFLPGFCGPLYRQRAVSGARQLLLALGYGPSEQHWINVGVGLATGEDYVGNVGGGGYKDFTAIGDTTNTAARLQQAAASGEVMLDAATYAAVAETYPDAERTELLLKGKERPVSAFRLPPAGGWLGSS